MVIRAFAEGGVGWVADECVEAGPVPLGTELRVERLLLWRIQGQGRCG